MPDTSFEVKIQSEPHGDMRRSTEMATRLAQARLSSNRTERNSLSGKYLNLPLSQAIGLETPAHIGGTLLPFIKRVWGNSEGTFGLKAIGPVTTDPKGEAHGPPVRNTPALTNVWFLWRLPSKKEEI